MRIRWEDGFQIDCYTSEGQIIISANREGLVSLANILADLADQAPGSHVHLDEHNSLEDGSCELIVQKIN